MNRKHYFNLTVVGVAFALVLGLGAFNVAKAVPNNSGKRPSILTGEIDFAGTDKANNSAKVIIRDSESGDYRFAPDSYGLHGTLRP